MDYYGIGFSNIRLQNDSNNYIYKYNSSANTFPEEVFVHEFIHSLERTLVEYGYNIPALHDAESYGYKNESKIGLKKWYADYMTKNILDKAKNEKVGLDKIVYQLKPVKASTFRYSIELNDLKETSNPFVGFWISLKNGLNIIRTNLIGV